MPSSNKLEEQSWYIPLGPQRSKIRELLSCPVDWQTVMPERLALPNLLTEYWAELVLDYQVDCEGEYIDDDLFSSGIILEIEQTKEVLDSQIVNINSWIDEARREYVKRTRRFAELKLADRTIYPKHLLRKAVSREDVREESSSGVSFFYPEISNEDLMSFVWDSMVCACKEECDEACEGPWRNFLQAPEMKLYAEYSEPLGASHGQHTAIVRFIFDSSTPLVHAHPITAAEAEGRIIVPHKFPMTWKDSFVSLYPWTAK